MMKQNKKIKIRGKNEKEPGQVLITKDARRVDMFFSLTTITIVS